VVRDDERQKFDEDEDSSQEIETATKYAEKSGDDRSYIDIEGESENG
jgi:hypothetical protein